MLRRSISAACILLLLVLVLAALWAAFDWPPPRLILKYGLPPTGGPTGRTMTIEGVEFVELKPGYFRMGSHFLCRNGDLLGRVCSVLHLSWGTQPVHACWECPLRWVEMRGVLWIARTEITNEQYERFAPGNRRDYHSLEDHDPALGLAYRSAEYYCVWLSGRSGITIRIPKEAEWEFAARAGGAADSQNRDGGEQLPGRAWYAGNSGKRAHRVGVLAPNAWGLCDMLGNAWEWTQESVFCRVDNSAEPSRPHSEGTGLRIIRGGCFWNGATSCRSSVRSVANPDQSGAFIGFRPVVESP